jgi:hypothetical protein
MTSLDDNTLAELTANRVPNCTVEVALNFLKDFCKKYDPRGVIYNGIFFIQNIKQF